jgi:predicted MFS family arabinose efflux permease
MTGLRLAAPLMALRLGYGAAQVGVMLAFFSLSQIFLALPAGRFADRHGMKPLIAGGVAMASLGAGLAVFFPIYPVLCLAALLTGGCTGITTIALQRHVGRMTRDHEELKLAFSWLSIGPAISNFIGPFSVGLLIDHSGFTSAFVFLTVIPFFAWVGIRTQVRHEPIEPEPVPEGQRAWDLLKIPMLRRLLWVNWFMSSSWDVHTFVVPLLGHERGISASAIGTIMGAFAIAAALIRTVLPIIAQKLTEWQIMTMAMLMTGVVMGIYPLVSSAWAMGVCSVALGVFLGCVQPMLMSTMHQITPPKRQGEALGVRLMMVNASSVCMPMLFGLAGATIGVSGLFWCVSAVVTSGSRLAWGLRADKNLG